jgi:adenylate cyclase
MAETRKLAAILCSDVVGYSKLAGADEDRILARLRALRSDLIDPTIAVHNGRVVKRTGDGSIVDFRSVVDAVRCAIEVQNAMVERNAGVPEDRRIMFRIGIHLGDVVEEVDGDLMGDGVNIAARLEGVAAPGAICLSEDAYRQVRGRLDLAVTDLGPTALKNIAEPVRAYSLQVGMPAVARPATQATPPPEPRKRSRLAPLVAGIIALIVLVSGTWYFLVGNRRMPVAASDATAAHLSIVVLPFANLSNDPAQDYFADGVTENLTTDLSRIRDSFVIARNTSFTYKGKNVDAKEIGKELGVRYMLEGSVQRDQGRVRVNAMLIDTQTGAHLWADRFEEDVTDLFKLQDRIVAQLANALRYELVDAEAHRAQRSQNPDAVDLAMRGAALISSFATTTKEQVALAAPLFEKALQLDPDNSQALAGKSGVIFWEWLHDRKPGLDYPTEIVGFADRAIAQDNGNQFAYANKAFALEISGRPADGLTAVDAGLRVNPNSAPLLAARGSILTYLRRFDEAVESIESAMRLSPRDPGTSQWFNYRADAEIGLEKYAPALADAKAAIEGGWRLFYPYLNVAVCEAELGHADAAKSALDEARRLNPALTIKWLSEHKPILDHTFDALRKIGLPEQ